MAFLFSVICAYISTWAMEKIILLLAGVFTATISSAQVDLSKDPAKPGSQLPKSNAQLLREATPNNNNNNSNPDLADQYKPDAANNGTTSTKTLTPATSASPGQLSANPQLMNTTNTQYNLGNGTKANSTIYYDDAGKVRSSGTSIEFGKKKK